MPTVSRHILFCTWDYFPAPAGGAERQARLQAEELTRRGHLVTVVCPRSRGFASGFVDGVEVRRLPCVERKRLRTLSYLPFLALFLLRRLRQFDLVHVHIANLQADLIVLLGRLLGRPVYVKIACGGNVGEVERMRGVSRLTRYVGLRGASRLQALSGEIRDELIQVGVDPNRIVQIPNGVDLEDFHPVDPGERRELRRHLELPQDEILVLFTGRFARYKGIDDLLAAYGARTRPSSRLVLVGSAETDRPMEEIAERPDLIVRPWTNRVVDYLQAADIFVVPSYADGMSNALLEAMACGLAPIATRVGAAESMISHGESGLLIKPADQTELAAALDELLANADERERLGRAASIRSRDFAIEHVVERLDAVYTEMLPASQPRLPMSTLSSTRP